MSASAISGLGVIRMVNLNRNNLDLSSSPYLRQHLDNPVWWQEWNDEVLAEAARLKRPILVSVGYSTCHWCHVMAAQAFSDPATADMLNRSFICIKVDRELRPDIDQYLMQYAVSVIGRGGWPLNVFLTPDHQPVYAVLYATASELREIAARVLDHFLTRAKWQTPFKVAWQPPAPAQEQQIIKRLLAFQDPDFGGFGKGSKFPPHSSLLFMLYQQCVEPDEALRTACERTLDVMMTRGLTDHLQGGIFRYCVDRAWTIPHFEKMLYDQAMALWCYSLAGKVLQRSDYRRMAMRIAACLDDTFAVKQGAADFRIPGLYDHDSLAVFSLTGEAAPAGAGEADALYYTALDADTDHQEGASYLWTYTGLQLSVTALEFERLKEVYDLSPAGNYEGKIHLVRKSNDPLDEIEIKLLDSRRRRPQSQRDEKILCGINALTVVALLQAGRHLEIPVFEKKAARMMRQLLAIFWDGQTLGHALSGGTLQKTPFLFDAAAMLLAASLLTELHPSWRSVLDSLIKAVEAFRKGDVWYESLATDFMPVAASWYDHPIPSSVSMAETALIRTAFQTGRDIFPKAYVSPYQVDFYNIGVMISKGLFHVQTREQLKPWRELPPNTIHLTGRPAQDCYRGVCTPL